MKEKSEHQAPSTQGVQKANAPIQNQLEWAHRRVSGLLDESRQLKSEHEELSRRANILEQERGRLAKLLVRSEQVVRSMEFGIQSMRRSMSMQLGYLFTNSIRSLDGVVKFPYRMLMLLREIVNPNRSLPGSGRQIVPVPIPEDWFPASLRRELSKLHVDIAKAAQGPDSMADIPAGRAMVRPASQPARMQNVRIATIMDEFTFSAYRECCKASQLTADGWREEMVAIAPHFLLVESAWDGRESSWLRKVSGASKELRSLVAYCKKNGIPVVFWSKEDPVHFKTFLATARLADVVFTTDIDCIKHYKEELGHENVFLLPFATQPRSHNPIESYARKAGFCFAGSYYVRYPVRQRDFRSILDAVSQLAPVEIYDRNHGKEHPNYIFPEEYRRYILGNLAFDQIDIAYKGYEYGININTVKNSQSMFARRVFDLLASNTTVVSNYSRGLRLMFGDLVVSNDDSKQLLGRIRSLQEDELFHRKHRLAGLRKVMREHTYQHRLAYVMGKVFRGSQMEWQSEVVVLAMAGSEDELAKIMANFDRQVWHSKKLVLCFKGEFRPRISPVRSDVRVLSKAQAITRPVSGLTPGGYVAGFNAGDYYGPNYLTDLALATSYSPTPVIGKASYYVYSKDGVTLESDGSQYHTGGRVARRRGMARCDFEEGMVAAWIDGIESQVWQGETLSIDEFSYCADAHGDSVSSLVDDLVGLDEGLPVAEMLAAAEAITADVENAGPGRDESAGLPAVGPQALFERLGVPVNKYLASELDGEHLVITSTLPVGQHAYAYLSGDFSLQELHATDIVRAQLVAKDGDALDLVLVFHDANDQKISHALVKAGGNVTVAVPAGTRKVRIGLRVGKAGKFPIGRLVFDHVPLGVDTMVTRSRYLLVAKNYPSYEDLYKHAFVHKRISEYKRQGVDVDVFRMGGSSLRFYEFEGIDIAHGQSDHLRAMLTSGSYDAVLTHVLDEGTWSVLQEFSDSTRIYVWAHGSEIQPAHRRECDHQDDADRKRAVALGDRRMSFWSRIFQEAHPNLKMVFISQSSAKDAMDDIGVALSKDRYEVIHNFIDGRMFRYAQKPAEQRLRVLSVRPYSSHVYANDLAVEAILLLSKREFFGDMEFRLVGDGPLFDATVEPLRKFDNVVIDKGFLAQADIAELHREYGVFLVPSRMDSQGVSRDEAMASGLVPVTNRVAAIPEFVDESCAMLADPEDAQGLASAIERLYREPELFMRMSAAAACRVREQSGFEQTIAREIALFQDAGASAA